MSDSTSTKINFLEKVGTNEIPHSGGTLLDHLVGVSEILKEMNALEYVQDAGLFHSIYETAIFHHQTVSDRQVVQDLIGEQAEHLVYLFYVLDRDIDRQIEISVIEDKQIRGDLMLMDFANNEERIRRKEMSLEEAYNV
tara:strand:+ start:529 stop:945 length:417 start_codon:yes stop_codon:yes gene_type:complete